MIEIQKEASFSAQELAIAAGAALRLQQGAKLLMEAFRFQKAVTEELTIDSINTSVLNVTGTLELGGEMRFCGTDYTAQYQVTQAVTGSYSVESGYLSVGGSFANEDLGSAGTIDTWKGNIPTQLDTSIPGLEFRTTSGQPVIWEKGCTLTGVTPPCAASV